MLRTQFRWEKLERPAQIILKEHKCDLHVYDLTDKNKYSFTITDIELFDFTIA